MTGSHESIPVADEAGRCGVESAQKCGVVRGHASGLQLAFDTTQLIRREVDAGLFDAWQDLVYVPPYDQIGKGARRLSRVLGNENPDSFPRDA